MNLISQNLLGLTILTVRYALDDFLRGNPLERAQVYEVLNRIGVLSVDEIRRAEDLVL